MRRPELPVFVVPNPRPLHLNRNLGIYGYNNLTEQKSSLNLDTNLCQTISKISDFNTLLKTYNDGPRMWPALQKCVKELVTQNNQREYYIPESLLGFTLFLRSLVSIELSVNVNMVALFISSLLEIAKLPSLVDIYIIIRRGEKASSLTEEKLGELVIAFLSTYCLGFNSNCTDGIISVVQNNRYATNVRLRFEEIDLFIFKNKFFANFPGILSTIGYRLGFTYLGNSSYLEEDDYSYLEFKEDFEMISYDSTTNLDTLRSLLQIRRVRKLAYEVTTNVDFENYRILEQLDLSNLVELYVPIPIVNLEVLIRQYPNITVFQVTGAIR